MADDNASSDERPVLKAPPASYRSATMNVGETTNGGSSQKRKHADDDGDRDTKRPKIEGNDVGRDTKRRKMQEDHIAKNSKQDMDKNDVGRNTKQGTVEEDDFGRDAKRRKMEGGDVGRDTKRRKMEGDDAVPPPSPSLAETEFGTAAPVPPLHSKVGHIFHHLYARISTLYKWISQLNIEGLIQDEDPPGYIQLLHSTIVAEAEPQNIQPPTSLSQASHLREVILRVVERLRRKNIKNILTMGFEIMSDNPHAHVGHMPGLEYRSANSAFNRLQYSPWKKLLSRIGDELMTALLERTSIFHCVPPSNYIQFTGIPIYDLIISDPKKNMSILTNKVCSRKRNGSSSKRKPEEIGLNQVDVIRTTHKKRRKRRKKAITVKSNTKVLKAFDFHRIVPRQVLLYSKYLAEQLPTNFCLATVESPSQLRKMIFEGTDVGQVVRTTSQSEDTEAEKDAKCKIFDEICRKLLQSHRKCRYKSLLNHHCKTKRSSVLRQEKPRHVPVYTRGSASQRSYLKIVPTRVIKTGRRQSMGQLLEDVTTPRQVFLFLRAVCLQVLPRELFGDERNRRIFFKHLEEIVSLGRHEKYCLGQMMMGVKVMAFGYLPGDASYLERVVRVAQIHWWLIRSFIFPLIQAFFYVTETNVQRNRLVFYRKNVWMQLHNRGLRAHLQLKMLSPVSKAQVEQLLKSDCALGVSNLRFLPKLNGLRPVVNMGKKPDLNTGKKMSINAQLKSLLSVLQFHVKKSPELLESSKFGLDDIYDTYQQFVTEREARQDSRPLYFVKTDINKCFDNIRQDKLFDIIKNIISSEDEYITRRYVSVVVAGNRIKPTFHRETFTLLDYEPDFVRLVRQWTQERGLKDMIWVDQVLHLHNTACQLLSVLQSHLFNNIIKIGRRFYRQMVGIGQGSVLSTMLCSLYTADMERNLQGRSLQDELLMRLVDDNLFITPHRDRAVTFLQSALEGSVEYNFSSNMDKILVNFETSHPLYGPVPRTEEEASFPWCGVLINTNSLDVSVDYTRYAGQCVRDTVTVDFSTQPGVSMKNKLLLALRSRCHSLYLDPRINSAVTQIHNVYKAFLLSAYKMHCFLVSSWPESKRKNHVFLKNVILVLAHYLYNRMQLALKGKHSSEYSRTALRLPLIKWLCMQAFVVKLRKHHSMYSSLLSLLKCYRKGCWKRMAASERQTVDFLKKQPIPSEFLQILERRH